MGFAGSKSRCWQGCFLLDALRENPFPPVVRDGLDSLACGHISLTFAFVPTSPLLLRPSCLPFIRTAVLDWVHLDNPGCPTLRWDNLL